MPTVTLEEAQANLPEIIHHLEAGQDVVVTEGDQIVARIVAEQRPIHRRPGPGLCKGMITIVSDDEDHLAAFEEYMP